MKRLELLAPAGSLEALKAALHFGADAVYGGMKRFGLRAFAGNFDPEALSEAVRLTHGAGKQFYVTLNSFPFDDELEDFVAAARQALACGVDAAIVADLGAIRLLRREVPELPLHVSTQANTVNLPAVEMYRELGCRRVILAREMSLDRIRALRAKAPEDIQLETFVHGASCMAYSGRCMLSAALTGRSANRGACAQPCRWEYAVMEKKRPGEYYPVAEDGRGTYLFSARDLCLMPLLPDLCEAGISSLKIEGRMKTEYYVAVVTGAYRRGLDLLAEGKEAFEAALSQLMEELKTASHRESDTGFLLGAPEKPGGAEGFYQSREYLARVLEEEGDDGRARLLLKNRFFAGDALELMTASGVRKVVAAPFLREKTGEILDTLGIAGETIRMPLPGARTGDLLRGPVRNHRQEG
ncbi:MAG: U32 family peptidase [Clostridiales bacterium]|nr:U32 family peptidase [Clostridiales bacterium]